MRVVSLIASATEIVCALGLESALVGRSHECDFPESVKLLPACTAPKFDVSGSSADIDRRVRETLQKDALSVYAVDDATLADLKPDVIITQSQCEVCAVSLKDVEAAVKRRCGLNARIVSLTPNSLDDVYGDIAQVARALDVRPQGDLFIESMKEDVYKIEKKARNLPKVSVACLEWLDPLMAAGNWTPTLIEAAGGRDLFGLAGKHSPPLSWDALRRADPDVIVAAPCGFDLARTRREAREVMARDGWSELKAFREKKVFLCDGNAYFNRPGPRLVASLEILAEILHPETFRFGHRSKGWELPTWFLT